MATKHDHKLSEEAKEKRQNNPNYRPSKEELKAIDAILIEQEKKRN
jgi:hypothetical protein